MEISIVALYTIEDKDEIYLYSLKNLVSYFRKYLVSVELIITCSSNSSDLVHKAILFTSNKIGGRVVTSNRSNIKNIISNGLNSCNKKVVLLLTEDFIFDFKYDYLGAYKRYTSEHKRFHCFWDVVDGTNHLLIGSTYDFKLLSSFLTAKTYTEIFMQVLKFCNDYGKIYDFYGYYKDFNFYYTFWDKLRMRRFLHKCSILYQGV